MRSGCGLLTEMMEFQLTSDLDIMGERDLGQEESMQELNTPSFMRYIRVPETKLASPETDAFTEDGGTCT